MRDIAATALINWIEVNNHAVDSIAVVGGSSREPELALLLKIYPDAKVTFLGIDNLTDDSPFFMFDLNFPNALKKTFDVVICSQVLEHIWNLETAFENLTRIVDSEDGILWLNCPASNMVHGSPHYYSAGYAPEMLSMYLEQNNFNVIISRSVGSRRLYFFTHTLQYWPTRFELAHPVITYRPLRSYGRNFLQESIRGFFGRLYSVLLSNRQLFDSQYSTETFVLSKPKESSRP